MVKAEGAGEHADRRALQRAPAVDLGTFGARVWRKGPSGP